jgi:hypothetical protein
MTEQTIKHRFLCCNQETYEPLIWKQYGYWHYDKKRKILYPAPEWATRPEVFEIVEHLVKNLRESNLQIKIETSYNQSRLCWEASWILYDGNNPHIEQDNGAVTGCKTEQEAHAYAMQRYHDLKYLYDGDVEAMLVYKKTGIACLPNWNHNEIDNWGFKLVNDKIVKSRVPRAAEVKIS